MAESQVVEYSSPWSRDQLSRFFDSDVWKMPEPAVPAVEPLWTSLPNVAKPPSLPLLSKREMTPVFRNLLPAIKPSSSDSRDPTPEDPLPSARWFSAPQQLVHLPVDTSESLALPPMQAAAACLDSLVTVDISVAHSDVEFPEADQLPEQLELLSQQQELPSRQSSRAEEENLEQQRCFESSERSGLSSPLKGKRIWNVSPSSPAAKWEAQREEAMNSYKMLLNFDWEVEKREKIGRGRETPAPDSLGSQNYMLKCSELATVPSTRLFQQLPTYKAQLESLGPKGGKALAASIKLNNQVRSLQLNAARLDTSTVQELASALMCNHTITELDLSKNKLSTQDVQSLAELLNIKQREHQVLRKLTLNECGVTNGGALVLAYPLQNGNCFLQALSLSKNTIGDTGAHAMGEMIGVNRGLQSLDLSWNSIQSAGGASIAKGLTFNESIEELYLGWNGLGDHGGACMGMMFRVSKLLTLVDLSANRIGPEGTFVIAEGLKLNESIVELLLNENPCGKDGIRHLVDMLQGNDILSSLGLEGCSFGAHQTQASFSQHLPSFGLKLDLSVMTDWAIASKICYAEQNNPGSMINVQLNAQPKQSKVDIEALGWPANLPTHGHLNIDFKIRYQGTPQVASVLDMEDLLNLRNAVSSLRLSEFERLQLLALCICGAFFTAVQAGQMLTNFAINTAERFEAAVCLFFRVVDSHNSRQMCSTDSVNASPLTHTPTS
ncbi:hypothetical protein CYMTET_29979 [Cymbomonas tetramitiformis]|uniref:Uncharacterized protein n=1 Tax=Cymbomonas tetramitiformis TaxID=36881 RepID=A0AAE0FJW6_9CHLO|nr:hypothetical protein CYMTET_29979 [Cymbomonas tetramitiformis]